MCRLWVSSATTDADLFVVVRAFGPDDREVLFRGMGDPAVPLAQGWLRASHRALDEERSLAWQPHHPHDRVQSLVPGEAYELDIEIWPTCAVLPAGHRLALTILGRDFDHGLPPSEERLGHALRGSSALLHLDRPADPYNGPVTVYSGPEHPSFLLVPFIPEA
jgi:predicted acyl esterase